MHLQDIEKLATKRGVALQSVKEVVQALVDDDLGKLYSAYKEQLDLLHIRCIMKLECIL